MGDASHGNEKVEQDEEIAEPQASPDAGCVNHGVAQRLEIPCFSGKGGSGRWKRRRFFRGGNRSWITRGSFRRCCRSRVLFLFRPALSPQRELTAGN
jgi:hypothetical protein